MSDRSGSENRQRKYQVNVRLTGREYDTLLIAATAHGMTSAQYLRKLVAGPDPDDQLHDAVEGALQRIEKYDVPQPGAYGQASQDAVTLIRGVLRAFRGKS